MQVGQVIDFGNVSEGEVARVSGDLFSYRIMGLCPGEHGEEIIQVSFERDIVNPGLQIRGVPLDPGRRGFKKEGVGKELPAACRVGKSVSIDENVVFVEELIVEADEFPFVALKKGDFFGSLIKEGDPGVDFIGVA